MWDGKKSASTRAFYGAMEIIEKKISDATPLEVFETAINNIKPDLEVRSKRVGGANYQVPMPVNTRRRQTLAIRWVLVAVRAKSGRPMSDRLADELLAAYGLMWRLQSAAKLLGSEADDLTELGQGGLEFILRETGAESVASLLQELSDPSTAAGAIIDGALGREPVLD